MALVTINRGPLGAPGEFMSLNKGVLFDLLREFTHAETRLYLYLVCNKDLYSFPFSKQLVENDIGLTKNSFYRARDGLIEKGHLVLKNNRYFFYELPIME